MVARGYPGRYLSMNHFIESVEASLSENNWYGALILALTLPDICGKLDPNGSGGSRARFSHWFNMYVASKYTVSRRNEPDEVMLNGNDCYALRCALLHEGSDVTAGQHASDAITRFQFVAPIKGAMIHNNMFNSKLQLQIDIFCNDICQAVRQWLLDNENDQDVQTSLNGLMKIHGQDGDVTI